MGAFFTVFADLPPTVNSVADRSDETFIAIKKGHLNRKFTAVRIVAIMERTSFARKTRCHARQSWTEDQFRVVSSFLPGVLRIGDAFFVAHLKGKVFLWCHSAECGIRGSYSSNLVI